MPRKNLTKTLGGALTKAREKQEKESLEKRKAGQLPWSEVPNSNAGRSVLEASNLDDLIATVRVRQEELADEVGEIEIIEKKPPLPFCRKSERAAAAERDLEIVSIPRRPPLKDGMTAEEIMAQETECFMEWRRGLALFAQDASSFLTPYERNLDFWRQLWRCVERSDLIVQIVDGRDPDFYHCRDLGRYVDELSVAMSKPKRQMLLVNKADFLTAEQRRSWAAHYEKKGVDTIFFSALHELKRQMHDQITCPSHAEKEEEAEALHQVAAAVPLPDDDDDDLASDADGDATSPTPAAEGLEKTSAKDDDADAQPGEAPLGQLGDDDLDVVDTSGLLDALLSRLKSTTSKGTERSQGEACEAIGAIGFVGYPNVGKSTVINAICGAKRVGMSKTPGKTKHIQTLDLKEIGVTLVDCPGLVFPSVVATRAHLVVNNTVPLSDLKDPFDAIRIIAEKIGFEKLCRKYSCFHYVADARRRSGDHHLADEHAFAAAYAVSRNHFLWVGVPDEQWAARKVLRDYVSGELLHCEDPPAEHGDASSESDEASDAEADKAPGAEAEEEDDEDVEDFDDVGDFIGDQMPIKMTKRKQRYIEKLMRTKGVLPAHLQQRGTATSNPRERPPPAAGGYHKAHNNEQTPYHGRQRCAQKHCIPLGTKS